MYFYDWLWLSVACLVSLIIAYPMRLQKKWSLFFGVSVFGLLILFYFLFGNIHAWHVYFQKQAKLEKAEQLLKQYKNKEEVIHALRARLNHTSQSAEGWHLLGRLYASENQWQAARLAFYEAHELAPQKLNFYVEYAVALWHVERQKITPQLQTIFQQILSQAPNQVDTLMILAADASHHGETKKAIQYWRKVLNVIPPESDQAQAIQQAIRKFSDESTPD